MAKKDDFDKIDSNKDGFISRDEYANADKSAGVKKEKLNWFLRLITLGDRFDIRDFWDRLKNISQHVRPVNDTRDLIQSGDTTHYAFLNYYYCSTILGASYPHRHTLSSRIG